MKSILALVDFSDVTPAVLKASGDLARAMGLKLHLLHAAQTVNYVTVTEVVPEGQGPALGIRAGDIVRRYNGEAIIKGEQLVKLTGETKGEAIPVEIQRGSETLKLIAKPGRLGLMLENKLHTEAK